MSKFASNGQSQLLDDQGDVVNPATEETLQTLLTAFGGSAYNFVQSDDDETYKYYGFASSTGWKIKRKTLASGIWEQSEGTGDYGTAWADRANKTYNYF